MTKLAVPLNNWVDQVMTTENALNVQTADIQIKPDKMYEIQVARVFLHRKDMRNMQAILQNMQNTPQEQDAKSGTSSGVVMRRRRPSISTLVETHPLLWIGGISVMVAYPRPCGALLLFLEVLEARGKDRLGSANISPQMLAQNAKWSRCMRHMACSLTPVCFLTRTLRGRSDWPRLARVALSSPSAGTLSRLLVKRPLAGHAWGLRLEGFMSTCASLTAVHLAHPLPACRAPMAFIEELPRRLAGVKFLLGGRKCVHLGEARLSEDEEERHGIDQMAS